MQLTSEKTNIFKTIDTSKNDNYSKYKLNNGFKKVRENNLGLKIHKIYDGPKNCFTNNCDKHFKMSYLFV